MGFFSEVSWQSTGTDVPTTPHCGLCGLSKKCFSPRMPPTGLGKRKVLFVSEAPGVEEDRQGSHLIGESGQLLRKILDSLDVDLDDCWRTSAVICHPPNNEIDEKYIKACRPNLIKTIRDLAPMVIIPLGGSPVQSLIQPLWKKDMGPISRWVGWTIPSGKAWICPTYHPSYLLKMDEDEQLVSITRKHLKKALSMEFEIPPVCSLSHLQQKVEVILTDQAARARLRDLLTKCGLLAFDYETTGLKPENPEQRIVSCSFCLNGEDTWAFPVTERTTPLLSRVLLSPNLVKIASNLKFEERWTRAKMGHGVVNWNWDTMQAAHVLDNRRQITSVKFQSFVLLGIGDYNSHVEKYLQSETANGLNRITDLDIRDVLLYNGLDSLLEYRVAQIQKRMMGWR